MTKSTLASPGATSDELLAVPVKLAPGADKSGELELIRRGAVRVVRRLRERGFEAWFVGGCVRDRLLGRAIGEYDIATDARPEQVTKVFRHTIAVGAQFGVIVVIEPEAQYEVATFRAEAEYTDGRRPGSVRFVNAKEDVLRRDFTINGLLEDPDNGDIADFVGGKADLSARVLRAIGDPHERFAEDHLRMLRAVRFTATLGFALDDATWKAMIAHAASVTSVAMERVQVELRRAFAEGDPEVALRLLDDSGLLAVLFHEVTPHAIAETRRVIGRLGRAPLPWVLALLLRDAPPGIEAAFSERLKLSRDDRDLLAYLRQGHARVSAAGRLGLAGRLRFVREPHYGALSRLERVAADGIYAPLVALIDELAALKSATPAERLHPPRLLDGNMLRKAGYRPGPAFKTVLDAVEDEQLEGRLNDEAAAFAFAAERLASMGQIAS